MPLPVDRLAIVTVELLIERPNDGVILTLAPTTTHVDLECLEAAIRHEATMQGLLIGTSVTFQGDAVRLGVTHLDHRPRRSQRHQKSMTRQHIQRRLRCT